MVKTKTRVFYLNERLSTQLALANRATEIRNDVVLAKLVARARQRLNHSGDSVVIAHQIAVDLGYYLVCHQYEMPRAAYDLLAIAYEVSVEVPEIATIIELPQRKN